MRSIGSRCAPVRDDDQDQPLIEVQRADLGVEALRAVPTGDGAYRILSVPVFVYGISRGTVVSADAGDRERLQLAGIRAPSPGATIRAWIAPTTTPKHVDDDYFNGPLARSLGLGPATLFEPTTVAIHLADRRRMADATRYLDGLIRLGVLTGWEFGDPGAPGESDPLPAATPWQIVHPPATETDEGDLTS